MRCVYFKDKLLSQAKKHDRRAPPVRHLKYLPFLEFSPNCVAPITSYSHQWEEVDLTLCLIWERFNFNVNSIIKGDRAFTMGWNRGAAVGNSWPVKEINYPALRRARLRSFLHSPPCFTHIPGFGYTPWRVWSWLWTLRGDTWRLLHVLQILRCWLTTKFSVGIGFCPGQMSG